MNRRYALKQMLAGGSSLILLNEALVSRVLKEGEAVSTLTINIDSSRFDDLTNVNGTVEITDAIAPGIQAGLLGNFPLALVRVDQSTISALEKYCMHQGCEVGSYNGTRFECPCHGSRYSSTGAVLRGPTTAPLKSYTTSLNGSILTVSGLPGNTSWNLTSADDVTGPTAFELKQNYPNPFGSPSAAVTEITYVLGTATQVHLSVYDTSGRNVATLVDSKQGGGVHTVRFDASHLAAGTYFYTLRAGNFIESKRMQLLK